MKDPSATTTADTSVSTNTADPTNETSGEKGAKTRQQKAMNKSEKINVIRQVKMLHNATLSMLAMMGVCSQLPLSRKDFKVFCEALPVNSDEFLSGHLKRRFVTLYEECATISD